MGKDKYENDELLKHRLPTDVWFHVADLSSAHVYVRSRNGNEIWSGLENELINEMCQLVKDNSIHGRKKEVVNVHYTPAMNVTKTRGMPAGQIHYVSRNKVKTRKVVKDRTIANRLKKTKVVKSIQFLREQTEDYLRDIQTEEKEEKKKKRKEESILREQRRKQEKIKNYDGFFDSSKMESNKSKKNKKEKKDSDSDSDSDFSSSDSDDFM